MSWSAGTAKPGRWGPVLFWAFSGGCPPHLLAAPGRLGSIAVPPPASSSTGTAARGPAFLPPAQQEHALQVDGRTHSLVAAAGVRRVGGGPLRARGARGARGGRAPGGGGFIVKPALPPPPPPSPR